MWQKSLGRQQGGFASALSLPVLVGLTLLVGGSAAWGATVNAHSQPHSYQFGSPDAATVVGGDLFVANSGNSSVTEVASSNGSYVRTISGTGSGLDAPSAVLAVNGNLFVANRSSNSVSEFKVSNGQHVRTIYGTKYRFSAPNGLALFGQDLFVLNAAGSVTEVSVGSGALIGTARSSAYRFKSPNAITVADGKLFVVNTGGNTVSVLNASTRAVIAVLSGSSFGFNTPKGIAFDGSNLWVTNELGDSVTEFSPTTLRALQIVTSDEGYFPDIGPIVYGDGYLFTASPPGSSPMITQIVRSPLSEPWMMCNTNGPYDFSNPQAMAVSGTNLWVVNEASSSLTEMNTDTGALIRTVSNP
jgi:YVTN family beta-propeller protein